MSKKKGIAKVISQEMIAENIYSMWIESSIAKEAKCGQFISIYTKNDSKLLPRPISICEIAEDRLRIVYRIAGDGTKEFSTYKAGDSISILGPLGNGFPLDQEKSALIIGGGIGVPPMLEVSKQLNCNKKIVMGYRNNETFLYEELKNNGQVFIATEDGSIGTKGNVIDAIKENNIKADVIYACGPMPMLRALKKYAEENHMEAYISLEEKMACGVGACLGCVCKSKEVDDHSLVNNKRICKDGPVFNAKEVEI